MDKEFKEELKYGGIAILGGVVLLIISIVQEWYLGTFGIAVIMLLWITAITLAHRDITANTEKPKKT